MFGHVPNKEGNASQRVELFGLLAIIMQPGIVAPVPDGLVMPRREVLTLVDDDRMCVVPVPGGVKSFVRCKKRGDLQMNPAQWQHDCAGPHPRMIQLQQHAVWCNRKSVCASLVVEPLPQPLSSKQ